MKLILIRHGECLKKELDPPLSKTGILQAKFLAKRLSKLPITKVYVSNLKRAFQTFEEYHKLAANVPFEKTKDLREMYRVLVGETPKEGAPSARGADDKKRVELFLKQIHCMGNEEVAALFTHGNVIRYLLARFLESDPRKIGPHLCIALASISLVDIDKNEANIIFINDVQHLTQEQSANSYFINKKPEDYLA